MEHDKKLAFVANMTDRALQHVASTPNVMAPSGGMSHEKMLSFVTAMAKEGLRHLDSGGSTQLAPATAASGAPKTTTPGFIGGIGNFLGTNNQFQAAQAPIQQGTNTAQLNNAYTGAQGALGTQGGITNTLNSGLNTGASNQGALSSIYLNQIGGGGPNPAQAQLNQATGQNIAQQAALQASQRGAGANAGLIAQNAAQQGAATQQQAVGQAATLNAQQQLAAEQNLQNLSASQIGQGTGATNTLNNAQQNEQNILQGANTSGNNALVSQQSNINNVNAGISGSNQNNGANIVSGISNSLSQIPVIGSFLAKGGTVRSPKRMAEGGIVGQQTSGPQSYVGQWLNSSVDTQGPGLQPTANVNGVDLDPNAYIKAKTSGGGGAKTDGGPNQLAGFNAQYGVMNNPATGATDLPGGVGDSPLTSSLPGAGGAASAAPLIADVAYKGGTLMRNGGGVKAQAPDQKAVKKGDSLANDKIPALLSQGEVVIDRKTLADPGPVGQMARAVAAHINKRNKGGK